MVSYLDQRGVQHLVDKMLDRMYPVNSIYISTNSTSPASLYGGSWERYGTGRVLVSASDSDTDFTAGKTGGKKKLVWDTADNKSDDGIWMYAKLAIRSDATIIAENHTESAHLWNANSGIFKGSSMEWTSPSNVTTSVSTFGAINVPAMNPYVAVYIWRRTA